MQLKRNVKSSFFQQSFRIFIGMIIFPTILCWLTYIFSLNIYYSIQNLRSQSIGLMNQAN